MQCETVLLQKLSLEIGNEHLHWNMKVQKYPIFSTYRIDHGFEINIQGVAEDIYREIHGLYYLDNALLTSEVHDDTFWILWGII